MDAKLMQGIKKAIKKVIEGLATPNDLFGTTDLGFKRFEVLYCAGFLPKCTENVTAVLVAVKHKSVRGFNVSVFEVRIRDGEVINAMYDGRACVDFENETVLNHNVGYGSFSTAHADCFLRRMLQAQKIPVL